MKYLAAFYFSGTGNTLYVTKKLCEKLSVKYKTSIFDISDDKDYVNEIKNADMILVAFPIYGSDAPVPMRRFAHKYGALFKGKDAIIVETQYFFSGDGAATIGRALRKYGANIIAAEHFNMPNNLCDCKMFPIKNGNELKSRLAKTDKKIFDFSAKILSGKGPKRGFGIASHAVGFFSQRAFWRKGEAEKRRQLRIDRSACVGCGACSKCCPVKNIKMIGGKAVPSDKCALCYRCVNLCGKKAITLIGSSSPSVQYKGPKIK